MTRLCCLAEKYGSDKLGHYTPFYDLLLRHKRGRCVFRVLEIGIKDGASLRMWRDYFPEAVVYGMDKDRSTLFDEERIKTFYGDQGSVVDLGNVLSAIEAVRRPLDLIVDDGSHDIEHQALCAEALYPYLAEGGIYIIEDVNPPAQLLFDKLNCEFTYVEHHHVKGSTGRCVVISK